MLLSHNLGKKAENLDASYLKNSGYTILARNYRYLQAEVDLIVEKDDILVAVEVKARSIGYLLSPQKAVSFIKIKLLAAALNHFVQSKQLDLEIRFDLITYVVDGDNWERTHIIDAYYPFR